MYKKLFLSFTFINAILLVLSYLFIFIHYGDISLFGESYSEEWKQLFLFHSSYPLRNYLFPLFFSFYVHLSLKHIIVNLFLYVFISFILEKILGFKRLLFLNIFLHISILSIMTFMDRWIGHQHFIYSGASSVVVGLLSFYFCLKKKYVFLSLTFVLLLYSSYYAESSQMIDPHIIAGLIGIVSFFINSRLDAYFLKARSS